MRSGQLTTSAALFCDRAHNDAVPMKWFKRAVEIFRERQLSPILFTAGGDKFLLDDCYVLGQPGGDLVKWGESIPACRNQLIDEIKRGAIQHLTLDSPRSDSTSRSEWHASVDLSPTTGKCFLGMDQELVPDCAALLRDAYNMVSDLFNIHYGFAYTMPLADLPDCYASGSGRTTLDDVRLFLRRRSSGVEPAKTPDELWRDEIIGRRRYLTGLFRAAYSTNLLSDAHLQRAHLQDAGLGKLSQIGRALWLWELADSEIPTANELLAANGLLVSQANPSR